MKMDLVEYYYKKLLQAIVFSNNPEKYFSHSVLNSRFKLLLQETVEYCCEYSVADEKMKRNLLKLFNYIRFSDKDNYLFCNELIRKINSCDVSLFFWQGYLAEEYFDRSTRKNDSLDFTNDYEMEKLYNSLELDFVILKSFVSDEDKFIQKISMDLIFKEAYYMSLNKMLLENIDMFDYRQTINRIATIIVSNKKLKKVVKEEFGTVNKDAKLKELKKIIKAGKNFEKRMIK